MIFIDNINPLSWVNQEKKMAQWRKVLVSGSSADVSSLSVGTANGTAGTIVNNSSIAGSRITGSFTGSFVGDGSDLTGITATSLDIDNFGSDLTSATLAVSDLILVSDGGTDGRANIGDLATPLAGDGLAASSNTIALDLNELTAATVNVANDSIAIIDADDNSSKKESIADLVSGMAGTNLTASSGTLGIASSVIRGLFSADFKEALTNAFDQETLDQINHEELVDTAEVPNQET